MPGGAAFGVITLAGSVMFGLIFPGQNKLMLFALSVYSSFLTTPKFSGHQQSLKTHNIKGILESVINKETI